MARLIKVDGTETEVHPKGPKWTNKELQDYVGGYIEVMPGIKTTRIIMDEEGMLKMKPINQKATQLVRELLGGLKLLRYIPIIVGDVLVLDEKEKM